VVLSYTPSRSILRCSNVPRPGSHRRHSCSSPHSRTHTHHSAGIWAKSWKVRKDIMTRQFRSGFLIAAALAFSVIPRWASAQAYGPVAGPLYQSGLQHEMYVGYQRLSTDYSLATASGDRTAVTSGLDLQYRWHGSNNHLAVVGEAQSNRGTLLGQKLNTAAVGGAVCSDSRRSQPTYIYRLHVSPD